MFPRRGYLVLICLCLMAVVALCLPLAAGPNERAIKNDTPIQEAEASKGGTLWELDFKFKDPRLIKVNIPGRGERVCWYLWYQVVNRTKAPRTFIPDFELVTHDTNMVYPDQILPTVQEAIQKIEDPTNYYKIRNSVTISGEPIPVTPEKSAPKAVTGVAIWTDPNEPLVDDDPDTKKRKDQTPKLLDSNKYSIFIAGLSNGWSQSDAAPGDKDKKDIIRRKTLQLVFQRFGDKYLMKSEAIKFQPPEKWIYRASMSLSLTGKAN